MANNNWRGCALPVAQVFQFTIGSSTTGHTFIITVTETDGADTATLTYAATAADTTPTLVAASFVAAWNASGSHLIGKIAATSNGAVVSLTAKTAGRPFTAAKGAGTGTITGDGVTTASSGPNDGNVAENWSDGVPTASDTVYFPPGTPALLYGLNLSAVTVGTIGVLEGANGQVGRVEDGKLYYLRIACTGLTIRGAASLYAFDVGSSAITPIIETTGSAKNQAAVNQVHLIGTAIAGGHVGAGDVGIATWPGETSTIANGAKLSVFGAGKLTVGSGATVTGTVWTANGRAAQLITDAALPDVTCIDGVAIARGAAITKTTLINGTLRMIAAGTYGEVDTIGSSSIDNGVNGSEKTISVLKRWGPLSIADAARKLTVSADAGYWKGDIVYAG